MRIPLKDQYEQIQLSPEVMKILTRKKLIAAFVRSCSLVQIDAYHLPVQYCVVSFLFEVDIRSVVTFCLQ